MHIGIFLAPYQRHSGAGEYYHHLIWELTVPNNGLHYTVFLPSDADRSAEEHLPGVTCVRTRVPSSPALLRHAATVLSRVAARHRPALDLLHCVNTPMPLFGGPTVLTVYDLREEDLPETHGAFHNAFVKATRPGALRRANRVIAISRFTAARLAVHYPACVSKTRIIPLGCVASAGGDMTQPPHPRPYILTVGHLRPHKNHQRLIRAFNALASQDDFPFDLVVVGRNDLGEAFMREEAGGCHPLGRIVFTGEITEGEKAAWYRHASLFVFPSLYEGFGLPLLEAFAAGVPVAASDIPIFRELYGLEKALFNPRDPEAIARTINVMVLDNDLRRRSLAAGAEITATYTWPRMAERTIRVYQELVNG